MKITEEMKKGFVQPTVEGGIRVHKIDHDSNGNPRYVVHFSDLGIKLSDYGKIPGLVKYRGKWFGGGYVFQSYYLEDDLLWMLEKVEKYYNK